MDLQQAYELDDDERKKYSFESPYPHQYFALPKNVVYYINITPSSAYGFLKLLQTCKYFYAKSRILPVQNIKQNSIDKIDILFLNNTKRITVNLEKLNRKLWIYKVLSITNSSNINLASSLTEHVYQCCLQELHLRYQTFFFGELKFLVTGGQLKHVSFVNNIVLNGDGKIAEFEKVFEAIKCASLNIAFADEGHGVGEGTAAKIAQIMDNEVLPLSVSLANIPQTFEFAPFAKFLKNNMILRRKHTFDLLYSGPISDSLKKQLQEFVDEILQFRYFNAQSVPIIYFLDIQTDSLIKLSKMRRGEFPEKFPKILCLTTFVLCFFLGLVLYLDDFPYLIYVIFNLIYVVWFSTTL